MKRIKPQHFLILLLVAALAAAPFLIRGLIDRSDTGKEPTAAVTPTPETTAEPTPTPEPDNGLPKVNTGSWELTLVNAQNPIGEAVPEDLAELEGGRYFDGRAVDALKEFIAAARAEGLSVCLSKTVGTVPLPQLLSQKTFGKVYIMLGINELGNDLDDITAKFSSLIDTVRAAQPNAIVYVEANLHVGPSRSSTDATFNNPRINRLNEKLAALADGKDIFYIDINEVFDDENGNLRADASGDSTHVYAKYDLDWCDWLCTKAIVR